MAAAALRLGGRRLADARAALHGSIHLRTTPHHGGAVRPVSAAPAAVLALHGSGGSPGGTINQRARQLAEAGFLGIVARYFERTGTITASEEDMERNFEPWMRTIIAATDYAAGVPGIARIGLVGISLGAYLALSVASHDRRVAAVVDYYGGLPELFVPATTALPPVLILHGEKDPTVPVTEAYKLQQVLERLHVPYEIKLYPEAGHEFTGADAEDAMQRTIAFLTKYLFE